MRPVMSTDRGTLEMIRTLMGATAVSGLLLSTALAGRRLQPSKI
jgi:hypothetical protein